MPSTRAEPLSFVLSQDVALRRNLLLSATSQQGARVGTAYPSKTNEGDLLPYMDGVWDTSGSTPQPTPTTIQLVLTSTGGLFNGTEWAWKFDLDASDQYRGAHDLRYMGSVHVPWATKVASSHNVVAYSSAFNRVLVARYRTGTQQFDLAYRSTATSDPSANYTTLSVPATPFGLGKIPDYSLCGYSSIVELPDGSLRWFYCYIPDSTAAPSYMDVDMLVSNDGGLTWAVGQERILTMMYGSTQQIKSMRVAVSGDWLRMEMWNYGTTPQGMCSGYSGDRGATWALSVGTPDGLDATGNGDSYMPFERHDIVGLGTLDGSFFRVRAITSGAGRWAYETCARDGAWSETFHVGALPSYLSSKAVYLARGGAYIYLLAYLDDGAGGASFGGYSYLIPADRLNNGWSATSPRTNEWVLWGQDVLGVHGVQRYGVKNACLAWVGDRLALCAGGIDRETGTAPANWTPASLAYWSGYSRRPVVRDAPATTDEFGSMFTAYWSAQLGAPASANASAFTPWTRATAGAPTQVLATDWMEVGVAAGADTSYYAHQQAIAGATQFMANAGVVGWTTRARAATGAVLPTAATALAYRSPAWGAVSQAIGSTGLSYNVGVHIANDGRVGVFDACAVNTLYVSAPNAAAGITQGTWWDFRLAFSKVGANQFAEVAWAKAGDSAWQSTGVLTLTTGVLASAYQLAEYGHKRQNTITSTYDWKEMWYSRVSALGQFRPTNPSTIRGVLTSSYPYHVTQGVSVRWGGGGGFDGDTFTAPVRYVYGAEQLFTASPESHWRSTTATTQQLVLDAQIGLPSSEVARLHHSGAAVAGTNSRYVRIEYAGDAAFTTPTALTIDGLRYTATVPAQIFGGNAFTVNDGSLWADMELAGHYLRAQPNNASANPAIVRIEQNHGNVIVLSGITQSLFNYGITGLATLDIWADRHLYAYPSDPTGVKVKVAGITAADFPRYMRLTVPSSDVQGAPPEGYWRIGALVAGMTLPLTVPMNWEHSDEQAGNVQLDTASSGLRSAYQLGEPRRVVKGTSEGDITRWRDAFRSTVRHLGQYGTQVMVLATDDQQQNRSMLYARFTRSTELENAGWNYNSTTSRWEQVGDLSMTFEEEL
jgi:hypothetical protein